MKTGALLPALAGHSLGHLIMIEPHPYNLDTEPLYQTWPLKAGSLPFPCQNRYSAIEEMTNITAGQAQTVRFWTRAPHGGGSCQFSIGYGYPPPADPRDWHVVHSIVGDCPARAAGNLETLELDPHQRENGRQCGDDTGVECVRQYEVAIPRGMLNGQATFSFTWFNKIGDREMYQSCSPVFISGGGEDEAFVDGLPAPFMANYEGHCSLPPSPFVVGFPEPGNSLVINDFEALNVGPCADGSAPVPKIPDGFLGPGPVSSSLGTRSSETPQLSSTSSSSKGGSSSTASSSAAPTSAGSSSNGLDLPTKPSYSAPPQTSSHGSGPPPSGTPSPMPSFTTSPRPAPPGPDSTSNPGDRPPADLAPGDSSVDGSRIEGCTPEMDGQLLCINATTFVICNQVATIPQRLNKEQKCVDNKVEFNLAGV
jgi:hypothetical protein